MSVKFRDYYEILGVKRNATAEEIRRAYRDLARKFHPDVNKNDPKAEEKLKEVNEAYEVLKDKEKRRKYDALGANWKNGQEFRPPPGYGQTAGGFNFGGFSDFFEAVFGGRGPGGQARQDRPASPFGNMPPGGGFHYQGDFAPEVSEAEVSVPLDLVVEGGTLSIVVGAAGHQTRKLDVRIPKGIAEGKKLRLAGQGEGGGDLILKINYGPGQKYKYENGVLLVEARVPPSTAALGGKATVPTPDGDISLTIPPGSSSGRRLRLRGKGIGPADGKRGDLHVQIMVAVPASLSEEQKGLYEKLAALE
ncbi:MAG: DnaJ domain-containing protein [Candidatus Sumerlaeia bacterium]|nr:DnaJ domain-containing protein [Candidatus Sumerlaeia bacterium]